MKNGVKVSVSMPSLEVAPYMRECLDSVCAQTLKEIEILCVDAGSTDGTWEILCQKAAEDSRVTVLRSEKKSYGYQVNLGFRQASGAYVAIVETDDYIAPEMFEKLYEQAERDRLDVIKGCFYRFSGEGAERSFSFADIAEPRLYGKILDPSEDPSLLDRRSLYSWAGIYRRKFLEEKQILHNETPGASYQDNGFFFQVFTQAKRLAFTSKPYYYLRRDNPNSSINSAGKVYCMCEEYDFIRAFLQKDPAREKRFAPMCARMRMFNYDFTFQRVAPVFKREFLHRYAADFQKLREAGELERGLYKDAEWEKLEAIMADPDLYYYRSLPRSELFTAGDGDGPEETALRLKAAEALLTEAEKKNEALRRSAAWLLGSGLLWLPRKVRGAAQCVREHGLRYTLRLAVKKWRA